MLKLSYKASGFKRVKVSVFNKWYGLAWLWILLKFECIARRRWVHKVRRTKLNHPNKFNLMPIFFFRFYLFFLFIHSFNRLKQIPYGIDDSSPGRQYLILKYLLPYYLYDSCFFEKTFSSYSIPSAFNYVQCIITIMPGMLGHEELIRADLIELQTW